MTTETQRTLEEKNRLDKIVGLYIEVKSLIEFYDPHSALAKITLLQTIDELFEPLIQERYRNMLLSSIEEGNMETFIEVLFHMLDNRNKDK